MRRIDITGQYKKDLRLARKRNLPEEKLNQIIFKVYVSWILDQVCVKNVQSNMFLLT